MKINYSCNLAKCLVKNVQYLLVGLDNWDFEAQCKGNRCYINTATQLLRLVPGFVEAVQSVKLEEPPIIAEPGRARVRTINELTGEERRRQIMVYARGDYLHVVAALKDIYAAMAAALPGNSISCEPIWRAKKCAAFKLVLL